MSLPKFCRDGTMLRAPALPRDDDELTLPPANVFPFPAKAEPAPDEEPDEYCSTLEERRFLSAPLRVSMTEPFLKKRNVGIADTEKACAVARFASLLIGDVHTNMSRGQRVCTQGSSLLYSHVDLEKDGSRVLARQLVKVRLDHLARSTPARGEIDDDELAASRLEGSVEVCERRAE